MKPLSGVKVLELARILAGPWCGQLLADLGAEVIKIERKGGGDDTRGWGPPFVKTKDGADWGAAYFHACNRGKSSLEIDFDDENDLEIVRNLAKDCDIVIENFKVGGLLKYGLDYQALCALNPKIIYASITGFGQDGPKAHLPGYDYIIQGMSGLMDITGDPEGEPQKIGVAVVDLFTGLYTANAIQAALYRRSVTGEGAYIDMALLDCATAMLANQAMNYLASGVSPSRLGNAHPNIAPYQVVTVKDGHMIVAVGNDGQFQRFCQALGATDIAHVPDYATNALRVANRKALLQALGPYLMQLTRAELTARLDANGVPSGPINRIEDVFNDPQIVHRGMRLDIDGAKGVASPIMMDGERMVSDKASPQLGKGSAQWQV